MSITQVRLLTDDGADDPVFSDGDITAFLEMNGGNALRSAAQALLVIAGSEARISKKIRTHDLTTDGPAVAAELRAQALQLRRQADEDDLPSDEDDSFFFVAEYVDYFSRPELSE